LGPPKSRKEVIVLEEANQANNEQEAASEQAGKEPGLSTQDQGLGPTGTAGHRALPTRDRGRAGGPRSRDSVLSRHRGRETEGRAGRGTGTGLASYRRALLAENAGRIVPELVTGSTAEELDGSLEIARRAFEAARSATLAEMASTPIPAGNPVRQGPSVDGMSSLRRSRTD